MTLSSGEKQERLLRRKAKAVRNRSRNSRISAFGVLGNRRLQRIPIQDRCQYGRNAFQVGDSMSNPPPNIKNAKSKTGIHFSCRPKYQKAANSPARNKPAAARAM